MKDVPTELPAGACVIAAICEREDVRDALISRVWASASRILPAGRARGHQQPAAAGAVAAPPARPAMVEIRGNVDTRLGEAGARGLRRHRVGQGRPGSAGDGRSHHRGIVDGDVPARRGARRDRHGNATRTMPRFSRPSPSSTMPKHSMAVDAERDRARRTRGRMPGAHRRLGAQMVGAGIRDRSVRAGRRWQRIRARAPRGSAAAMPRRSGARGRAALLDRGAGRLLRAAGRAALERSPARARLLPAGAS